MRRREDVRLLTGSGRYVDDVQLPGLVHAAFVRSPHAHARVLGIRAGECRSMPGVLAMLTGPEIAAAVRPTVAELGSPTYHPGSWYPLAVDKVRFVGEPVAVVVAENRYLAEDAAHAIEVDYDPLPPLVDTTAARAPGATLVHSDVPANTFFEVSFASSGPKPSPSAADISVEERFEFARVTGSPIENRGVIAWHDLAADTVRVWSSTQVPHILRHGLAHALNLPETRVVVSAPDVGGGFGIKMHLFPEEIVLCVLAMRLPRPVKWIELRRENLMASTHAHEQTLSVSLSATRDGLIRTLSAEIDSDIGAYSAYPETAALEPLGTAQSIPGPYAIPHFTYTTRAVATNKCPVGAYRGVGQIMGAFVRERLIDILAARLGMDPAEVRRRNFVRPEQMPFTAASGLTYDSGDSLACFERTLEAIEYDKRRRTIEDRRRAGSLVGLGLSSFVEYTGLGSATFRRRGMNQMPGIDSASVKVLPSGRVQALVGAVTQGQGHETTFAQILATELSLPLEVIDVVQGDTSLCPFGSGTFASRGVVGTGGALIQAAGRIREKVLKIAALLLEADPADLELSRGAVGVRGTQRQLGFAEIARAAYFPTLAQPRGSIEPGLEATAFYDPPTTFSHATHATEVEIDGETGRVSIGWYAVVEDCGRIVNPLLVDGQIDGAVMQGIGLALLEDLRYDPSGQLLTGTFMDYAMPTACAGPSLEIHHLETDAPHVLGGFKGMGESGTIGAPAALANAIADALGQERSAVLALPMTPERLSRALRTSRR